MALNKNEKKYLAGLVKKNLEHLKKEQQLLVDVDVSFLKAEHSVEDFLEELLKKLGDKDNDGGKTD